MKKLILAFLLLTSPCYASQEFKLGTEVSHIEYKEPGLMKESGIMYGLVSNYTYMDKWYAKLDGRFSFGQVEYSSENTGTISDVNDYILEGRILGGRAFPIKNLYGYMGLGYRYLNDDLGGKQSTTGHWGYERESNYVYMPLGVEYRTINPVWNIIVSGELDPMLGGRQISHFENVPVVPAFSKLTNHQSTGLGKRVSIELVRNGKVDISIGAFLRYWNIRTSKTAQATPNDLELFVEPKNISTEVGIQVKVGF